MPCGINSESVEAEIASERGVGIGQSLPHVRLFCREVVKASEVTQLKAGTDAGVPIDIPAVVIIRSVIQPIWNLGVRHIAWNEGCLGSIAVTGSVEVRDHIGRVIYHDVRENLDAKFVRTRHESAELSRGSPVRIWLGDV